MTERNSTREATQRDDGQIVIRNENVDVIEPESLVNIYNDHVDQLEAMQGNIDEIEEEMEDVLYDEDLNMERLHTVIESEPQNTGKVDPNTITNEDLEKFSELREKKQRRDQFQQSVQQIEEFLDDIEDTAKDVAEQVDEELNER
jgi:predicted transcriptional regulator